MTDANLSAPSTGRLAVNVMHFCRMLRAAGLPVGPGQTLAALGAVQAVGVEHREDFYWALHAALVDRRDRREVFDQAFHLFWRDPDLLKRAVVLALPATQGLREEERRIARRVAAALVRDRRPGIGDSPDRPQPPEVELDAALTVSTDEVLRRRDFEQMSADEIARAERAIAAMRLPVRDAPTRRFTPDPTGVRLDLRRTLRRSLGGGGAVIDLARRRPRRRPPPLVVLCDISGSMSRYSRLLLHFLHALASDRDRVHAFVFGTRLTSITRTLRHRDVDDALAGVGGTVQDWNGGTRIGCCLADFNQWWSRRVLGQGAVVLLITDGLERDDPALLACAMERLHKSCRRLIWLNPLLRWDGYAPRAQGARAMLPHVDEFRPVHSLDSLQALADALSRAPRRDAMAPWRRNAA